MLWVWVRMVGWLSRESSIEWLRRISIVGHLCTMPAILWVVGIHHVGVWHWVLRVSLHRHSHWRSIVGLWVSVWPMVSIEGRLLAHVLHLRMTRHVLILLDWWMWIWHIMVVEWRWELVQWHSIDLILGLALAQLHLICWNDMCWLHSSLSVLSWLNVVLLVLHVRCVVRFILVLVCLI